MRPSAAQLALLAIPFITLFGVCNKSERSEKTMIDEMKPVGPPPPPPSYTNPPKEGWSVVYDRTLGAGFGAYMQITIREKGDFGTVRLTANLPPLQEMGFFRVVLSDAEVDRVRDLVRASVYLKFGHRGPMRPDTPTTTLREGDDVSTFTPESRPPAPVIKVFDALEEIGREVAKHPFKTLRGEAKWTVPEVKRGEHVELTVVLRSVGSELIAIDNPLGSTSDTWVGLRLTVAKDKPQAQLDWERTSRRSIWFRRIC